jgi:hypothetical protein
MAKTTYRVFRLQDRFSVCKSNVWGVWRGEDLVFHGSHRECEDWLDAKENESRIGIGCRPGERRAVLHKYLKRLKNGLLKWVSPT